MKITDKQIEIAANDSEHGYNTMYALGFEEGAKWHQSQMQPIPLRGRLPTKEDGDDYGRILFYDITNKTWQTDVYDCVKVDNGKYTYWLPYSTLPEPPKEES